MAPAGRAFGFAAGTLPRLVLFGLIAIAAVAFGFLAPTPARAKWYVQHFGYYTIALTFAWFLGALWRLRAALQAEVGSVSKREWRQAMLLIAGCVAVAGLTAPWTYKVLYDEAVLQATAWHLHFFREVSTIVRGYSIDGVFAPFDTYLDKRPFFFAFLVSLIHDATGYRPANAFALNYGLSAVVLVQVYLLCRRLAGHVAAMAALLALGTLSLVALNATGAGMELLNLCMLLATIQLGILYLDEPNEARLAALVLCAVLLAQTRYESSLYIFPAALLVLEGWRRAGRIVLPPAAILAPALLIPYALHNTYLSGTPLLWELRENEDSRFALQHLLPNLQHAARYFFSIKGGVANSWFLSVAGMLALGYAAVALARRLRTWRGAPGAVLALTVFGVAIVANLSLLMFYYWGQLDDPIVSRLSLPFLVLLTLSLAFAVGQLGRTWRWIPAGVVCGALITAFGGGLAANAHHSELNTLDAELQWEDRVVAGRGPAERLIITNKSSLPWMLQHSPALLIVHARMRADAIRYHLERGTFREVLVFQSYRPLGAEGGFQITASDRLPDNFVLEPIVERRIGARIARISRLVEIKPADPAPAKPAPPAEVPPPPKPAERPT